MCQTHPALEGTASKSGLAHGDSTHAAAGASRCKLKCPARRHACAIITVRNTQTHTRTPNTSCMRKHNKLHYGSLDPVPLLGACHGIPCAPLPFAVRRAIFSDLLVASITFRYTLCVCVSLSVCKMAASRCGIPSEQLPFDH